MIDLIKKAAIFYQKNYENTKSENQPHSHMGEFGGGTLPSHRKCLLPEMMGKMEANGGFPLSLLEMESFSVLMMSSPSTRSLATTDSEPVLFSIFVGNDESTDSTVTPRPRE